MDHRGESWAEKYRPRRLSDIVGNPSALEELRAWADSFPKYRAAILHGPPGCGKTSAALALAAERGWEVVELNASDKRSADIIKHIVGHAAESEALSGETKLIILDEADNIHGGEDRGGVRAITEIVKRSEQPIVLIANELHKISSTLRRHCKIIRFRRLSESAVLSVLREICTSEGLNINDSVLRAIAKKAKGDLRSAINDLQAVATVASAELHISDAAISERDRDETIFSVMNRIFRGCGAETAFQMLINLDMTPEEVEQWMHENISHAAPLGMRCLCLADKFIGRTRRTGNFHLWKYASSLMACIAEAAAERKRAATTFQKYRPPARRRSDALTDNLARKIGNHAHIPLKSAHLMIPMLKIIFENDITHAAEISADLGLREEEIMLLTDGNAEKTGRILAKIASEHATSRLVTEKWTKSAADGAKKAEMKAEMKERGGDERAKEKEKEERKEEGVKKVKEDEQNKREEQRKQRTLTDFI